MNFDQLHGKKKWYFQALLLFSLWLFFIPRVASTEHSYETVLIFISLNLPDSTLKTLYQDAKNNTIPTQLMLTELYQNSFLKTKKRLKALNIEAFIHPKWFKKYQDKQSPIFCFFKKEALMVLHGHMSLAVAKAKIDENTVKLSQVNT